MQTNDFADPDVSNASRRIKKSEFETCQKNGVTDVVEMKIGYDGIVLANAKTAPLTKLTRKDLYLALSKEVPDPAGAEKLVPNPYRTWKDVNKDLPDVKIEVLGPPPTSGTRDALVELVMEAGCKKFDFVKAMETGNKDGFKKACMTVREDGAYIEAGENDNLIVQKLAANKNAYGIFGFSFLEENTDKIQGSEVEGHAPTFEQIDANVTSSYGQYNQVPTFVQNLGIAVVVVDYWTDATNWALVAKREDIVGLEIGFVNGQEMPEVFVSDVANVGSWFTNDKITYKIRHEYGGAITDLRAFDGSVVAG